MSIGEKLDGNRGIAPGFDFIRVFLALSIVAFHSYWVAASGSDMGVSRASWFPIYALVPAFFALSGFLIAGSAQRLSLSNFLINRGLRIVPALAVEIVASAFVLGPIFTALTLQEYFSSPRTWHYLTNIVGLINYTLPGVFLHLPTANVVNISLWTIPFEIICYAVMAGLIFTGLMRTRYAVLWIMAAWCAAGLAVQGLHLAFGHGIYSTVLRNMFFGAGPRLILFCLAGIAAYQFRRKIPYHWGLLAAAVAGCLAIAALSPVHWLTDPLMAVMTCAPIVYITLFVGVTKLPKLPFFHRGDYSYGIYLYGFPLQQAVKSALPGITHPWALTAVAVPVITLFAAFSWHFIEKPILKLRKNFSFIARTRLEAEQEAAAARQARPAAPAVPAAPAAE